MLPWTLRRWLGLPDPEPEHGPVEPARPLAPNPAWNHDLAMAVLEGRDAREPYLAYADWLAANNDPRAALVRGDDSVLEAHPQHFLGPLLYQEGVTVTWRWGFWESVTIDREWDAEAVPALVRELLRHPSALVLDALVVRADCIPALADVLADGDVLPLRTIEVDARGGLLGAWAAVWSRVPALRSLSMAGRAVSLGDIDLPCLSLLAIRGALDAQAQWSLARMSAPSLAALDLDAPLDPEPAAQLAARFPGL
ncbi:MAG: hypothetical protein H6737_30150 [Alphaproteobacteria bacterium]|nr:hypothetical protein [Alphaproteobacteria bacterium]